MVSHGDLVEEILARTAVLELTRDVLTSYDDRQIEPGRWLRNRDLPALNGWRASGPARIRLETPLGEF